MYACGPVLWLSVISIRAQCHAQYVICFCVFIFQANHVQDPGEIRVREKQKIQKRVVSFYQMVQKLPKIRLLQNSLKEENLYQVNDFTKPCYRVRLRGSETHFQSEFQVCGCPATPTPFPRLVIILKNDSHDNSWLQWVRLVSTSKVISTNKVGLCGYNFEYFGIFV